MDQQRHSHLLIDRPQTPRQKRPLSIAAPETPSSPVPSVNLLHWRASDLLSRVDQEALIKLTPKIAGSYCGLDRVPVIRSYMNVLIVLHDQESDKRWVARIPYDQQQDKEFLDSCVRPLEYVMKKFKGFRRPRLYHFALCTDKNNPVGVDYMLLDFIEGVPLRMWDGSGFCASQEQRKRLLDQIADIMMELLTKPVSEKDGFEFFGVPEDHSPQQRCSTTTWLYESVDRGIRKSLEEHNLAMAINYLIMRSQVPRHIVPQCDDSPWYIAHTDLHNRNIIVDEETNSKIHGIIDWDYAHAVPLQKAAVWPKLLEFVSGDEFPDLPEDHIILDLTPEKEYFLEIFAQKERKLKSSATTSGDTESLTLTNLIKTCSERNFFELAHHRMRVHEQWVTRHCQRTSDNVRAAWHSLHDFLALKHNEAWLLAQRTEHVNEKATSDTHETNQGTVSMWSIVELAYEFEKLELEAPFASWLHASRV